MFLLFLVKMFATHLKRPKRRVERRTDRTNNGHRQVEQTISLCPPTSTAAGQEGRGLRALHAQLSSSPSSTSAQPSAPVSPTDPLSMPMPSLPPSYTEAVSTPNTPLYPCDPPKYTELPEGGSTSVTR